jgi:hypothetical protein
VPYEFFEVSDLKVYNGNTLLAYNATPSSALQYSVTGAGVTGGGSITLGAPGAAVGNLIAIARDIPIKRTTDFPNAGPFNIQALNTELDKITAVQQNLETDLDNRVFRLGDSDAPNTLSAIPNKATRQNKLLGFDGQGQPVAVSSSSFGVSVAYATAFADTFTGNGSNTTFTLSSDPVVIANLDVSINGLTKVPLVDYTFSGTTLTTTTAVPNGAVLLVKFKEGLPNYSGDAQDIQYTSGFFGAVQQNVETKLEQYISVKDFGADCDGVADDSSAIQAAIDYANSIGGAVVNADGVCKVGTTVTVTQNVKFIFNDLKPSTSSTNVLRIYGGCTVKGRVDTSAFATYSGNAVTIDGNGENLGSIFRLDRQTDLDLVVKGGGDTGTAIYFKATDTKAWIMNVNLQADINKFRYGIRMEQTSTDLSKFITSNTIQASTSETITALSMVSSHVNNYGLDGNNIYMKSQPKSGTTVPIFEICGQSNIFDLIPWDWDTVVGTAPYAMTIKPFTRNSSITWRTDWDYINNLSTDANNVFTILFDSVGIRVPRIYTSRTDNVLPIIDTSIVIDNNRSYVCKTSTNVETFVLGINTSNNVFIQAPTIAGSSFIMDTRNATGIYSLKTNGNNTLFITPTSIAPGSDNALSNGTGGARWSVVYAATGTINTSDARTKQDVAELDAAEKRVAIALKGLIRKFRFKDAVEKKGEAARIHTGVIAQEVEAAFAAEGLDARRYGLLCHDELEEGDIYGIRYDELVMFILGAI